MVDQSKEDYDVVVSDAEGGESEGKKPASESQEKLGGVVEPIMVPLAELQKLRADKRELKAQNLALAKMLEAQDIMSSKGDHADDDLVTYGDLKRLQKPSETFTPAPAPKSAFRVGDTEVVELETEFKQYVPDYEKTIKAVDAILAKDPNLLSAIRNADNPPAMAYHLGKQILAAGALEGSMSKANPAEVQEKVERIEFNQTLPRNVSRPSGGGRNIMQFSAAEIAALPQDEFNEIWEKMTPSAREKLKVSIQTKRPVGNFPPDMK